MTTKSPIPAIDFVIFHTADLDQSQELFTKMGFQFVPEQSGPTFRQFMGAEGSPGFGLNLVSEETPPAGTAEIYFKTSALEELREEIIGKGVEASPILHPPFARIFNVLTPDKLNVVMMEG